MLRSLERSCKLALGTLTHDSGGRYSPPRTHKTKNGDQVSVGYMTSNPTGGTVDEVGQLEIKSIQPGDARVSIARTRLRSCFQSTLCMVLVALSIRLIVMRFLYQE